MKYFYFQNKFQEKIMKLSIIMPIYNEKETLEKIVEKVQKVSIEKEIIMVDDGSTDGTIEILKKYENVQNIKIIYHTKNMGKGATIRTAIKYITGDIVIIQDADLEYDPNDYLKLVKPIQNKDAKVIYGSRALNPENKHSYNRYLLGGKLVTFVANILYSQRLTDEPTCYKVFDTKLLKSIFLKCKRFEFCPEVTAKIAKKSIKIKEIPINYYPRDFKHGKKIKWYDGLEAIWTLIKYRFLK